MPRARWRDHSTHNGKHWIEQVGVAILSITYLGAISGALSLNNVLF
jgi:hypothetical protein